MKVAEVFILICIAVELLTTAKANGKCEKIEDEWWHVGTLKTCHMHSTAIDSKDFSITSDRSMSVGGFFASGNKQLEHLPNNLGEKFPNLLGLNAESCSIKKVYKDNFKGLGNLRHLWLVGNQIEIIDDDTFEYIPVVEFIHLDYNKIKNLNGRALASLHKLTRVDLRSNECINEDFHGATRIAELKQDRYGYRYRTHTGKCVFTECPSQTKYAKLEADLMAQSEELQALKIEFAKQEAKAEVQITHLNEVKTQLKETCKEICDARIELKNQEISNLSNDLQAKTAEINEKNEKIKQLEKKI